MCLALLLPIISFADERFIPLELWLGGKFTGSKEIVFPDANFRFGYNGKHTIKGPTIWTNPRTNHTIRVYDRSRFSKKEGKIITQLWTVTNNNQCLGRVFDNRGDRFIKNGCKFPLGLWKEGESRSFNSDYFDKRKGNYKRVKTITILDLGKDDKNCLKFKWEMTQKGSVIDDNIYEYCPEKGLVKVNGSSKF